MLLFAARRRLRSPGCISRSGDGARRRRRGARRSCPTFPRCRRSTSPSSGALVPRVHRGLAAGGSGCSGRRRAARSRGATSGSRSRRCCSSFAVWMVWSVVVAQAAGDRLHLHHRPAVLARGAAGALRRDAAHLLLLHGADLRRAAVDHAGDLVAADPGDRHRLRGAEPGDALSDVPGAGAALRLRRRQLRLLDGQHQLLLPQGGEGQRAGAERGPRQSRRLRRAVRGAARHHRRRVRLARRRPADGHQRTAGAPLWLQNAGFVWVPFIVASAVRGLVRHERHRRRQGLVRRAGGDLPAQAQLDHVLALYRHLRLLHRLFRGLPAARQDAVPGRRTRCSSSSSGRWSARCRARPPAGSPTSTAAGASPSGCSSLHDARRARRALLPRHQGSAGAFWGFFAMFMVLFFCNGRRQCLDLPDDPGDHAQGDGPPDAGRRRRAAQRQTDKESAAIIGFTSAIAAYGAFFIPKAYGTSIALTGGAGARCGCSSSST